MNFCKFSKDVLKNRSTQINNVFFTEYLPFASEIQLKVYLYGYFCCNNETCESIEEFSSNLNLKVEEVKEAFAYWQELKLVQIVNLSTFEIIYLPVKESLSKLKNYEDKYADFNVISQSLFSRMIFPNEYKAYYEVMEINKIEKDALLMIMKYCVETKGDNVGYPYILAVARNWAAEKITTVSKVEEKIKEIETSSEDILEVLNILGIKRKASLEERDLYRKWKLDFKYTLKDIKSTAKLLKKKGGMGALDNKLSKYYEMQLLNFSDIESYEKNKSHYYTLAREIVSKLGLYFSNLDPVIETYLNNWLYKGYSVETLKLLADFCFKGDCRTLEEMDSTIQKLYKLGCVSIESIKEYVNELSLVDEEIKKLLSALSLSRRVTQRDREQYNIWKNVWNISAELMDYAVSLSQNKTQPFLYFTKIINSYHEQNIKTLEQATVLSANVNSTKAQTSANKGMYTHSYSEEELNTLFDNLKEIDL